MKGQRRYLTVALLSSLGVAFVLAFLFGALAFVLYTMAYLILYTRFPALHEAIDRVANGKREDT
jgi:Na+-transporting methylmalonyl-CoA/oxaloacetate decarboxylase gamma subunit